jgi:hypothetical protein
MCSIFNNGSSALYLMFTSPIHITSWSSTPKPFPIFQKKSTTFQNSYVYIWSFHTSTYNLVIHTPINVEGIILQLIASFCSELLCFVQY